MVYMRLLRIQAQLLVRCLMKLNPNYIQSFTLASFSTCVREVEFSDGSGRTKISLSELESWSQLENYV